MLKKIKKALISVSDKSDLDKILIYLKKYKINIISSGGTYKEIIKLGYSCTEVSKFTKFTKNVKIAKSLKILKKLIPSPENCSKR